ncbi:MULTISPECIES: SMI1/KNR4 family protein [Heyndrickxia]|uniref:SMI1/KNR4 family protein n=1 Tax=Heyndrickxia TaxID=2837504 RepID=UPI002E2030C1|nr:SMI1/KNR4 family protein [Heyndrickxia coagulans]MED4963919.1 SMI1/KNR4 family protein [Heyndrickxia coagulans]
MSIENYEKAKQLIYQNEKIADFVGGRNNHLILMAEEKLGLTFSNLYRDFLLSFGAGNFGSQEIYGIITESLRRTLKTLQCPMQFGIP